ncbi:MAG: hypothetical protein ASARMPREDX12_000072 [Alectoria sarmentosa]|nr:MAG: hypothetical protein ASARMPREDX12_000072 [Alectoria sarmentosa]
MASTTQQDLGGQSLSLGLLSERKTHPTTKIPAPKKKTPRFESFPPEIRNMVYRNLFPPAESCKVSRRRQFDSYRDPQHRPTYVFHTAILRSNRLIGQEAKSMLYGSNLLVLINWQLRDLGLLMLKNVLQNVAFNHIPNNAPLPSCVAQVNHQVQHGERASVSMIVAGSDVHYICTGLLDLCHCRSCHPSASYSLVALPQLGWPYERVLEMIWLPLKALRKHHHPKTRGSKSRNLKVIDRTGFFEQADEILDMGEESEQESNTESERESDTEENESDESGSEDIESDEGDESDSNDDEAEEDDMADFSRASSGSDEANSGEDDGDEDGKVEDRSDEAASTQNYNTVTGEKTTHDSASNSGHAEDGNAATVVEDKSVAGGRSDDEFGHKVPGTNEP